MIKLCIITHIYFSLFHIMFLGLHTIDITVYFVVGKLFCALVIYTSLFIIRKNGEARP